MYLALALGGVFICLFHLLIHALAKANLFLIVGNLIHSRFSQQDFRYINAGNSPLLYFFIIIVRVLRLRGVFFRRGFFSKDIILIGRFAVITRRLSFIVIFSIITITFVYCIKIIYLFNKRSLYQQVISSESNILAFTPRLILTSLRIFRGYFYLINHNLFCL
jgi:NADH:ubiquinone oxidoreductase subunit 5 (subunit L)/multisubunit Na+/H+ antiporter MnhA subunit